MNWQIYLSHCSMKPGSVMSSLWCFPVPGLMEDAWIAKRLDRFFMAEGLCEELGKFRSWSLETGFLNHRAVLLQVDFDKDFHYFPFKSNSYWLKDEEFNSLVQNRWRNLEVCAPLHLGPMKKLLWILDHLRGEAIKWERIKKKYLVRELEGIEAKIQALSRVVYEGFFSLVRKHKLLEVDEARSRILLHKEEMIGLKSRDIWLLVRD